MTTKILFVADGRSPIALNWIGYFANQGYSVHLASLYPGKPDLPLAGVHRVAAWFLGAGELETDQANEPRRVGFQSWLRRFTTPRARNWVRHWLVPFMLKGAVVQLQSVIDRVRPDLIHAMRIPYEGMLAAMAEPSQPVVISIWGNDFTLHAPATPWMARYTRMTLSRAAALHADCQRDARLAINWGFQPGRLAVVLPGNGGVQTDLFHPVAAQEAAGATDVAPTVINPRGFRAYVRNDTFFRAIPLVLERRPQTRFVCPGMADEPQAQRWTAALPRPGAVTLLPRVPRTQMAELFRAAQVAVSITTHDGTPNTLLEAMACGCFPVAGDGESLREWISQGENGFLVDPGDPDGLARAILAALDQPELRRRAAEKNTRLISERAEFRRVMSSVEEFYRRVLELPAVTYE